MENSQRLPILTATERAVYFLVRSHRVCGWADFWGYGVLGDVWPPAFVSSILRDFKDQPWRSPLDKPLAEVTARLQQCRSEKGWGQARMDSPDAESTLAALFALDERPTPDLLDSWRCPGGGYSKYAPDQPFAKAFQSFTSPDVAITAAVGEYLGQQELHNRICGESSWAPSVWWPDLLYPLYRVLRLENRLGLCDPRVQIKARQILSFEHLPDGSWSHPLAVGGLAFTTALGVLCSLQVGMHEAAAAGLGWLLDHQSEDGGWAAFPMLHFPRRSAQSGPATDQSTLVADHNRTFASVLGLAACARSLAAGLQPGPAAQVESEPDSVLATPGPMRKDGFGKLECPTGTRVSSADLAVLVGLLQSDDAAKQKLAGLKLSRNPDLRAGLWHLQQVSRTPG